MIVVQRPGARRGVPAPATLRRYARAALGDRKAEVTLRIVGAAESRALNRAYRGKDKPTNVLSFPYGNTDSLSPRRGERARVRGAICGDLVLCAPVVAREAREQGKSARAHWAHLVVHGVLHLLGYDHERPDQARVMERRERAILAGLSFPDPYVLPGT